MESKIFATPSREPKGAVLKGSKLRRFPFSEGWSLGSAASRRVILLSMARRTASRASWLNSTTVPAKAG